MRAGASLLIRSVSVCLSLSHTHMHKRGSARTHARRHARADTFTQTQPCTNACAHNRVVLTGVGNEGGDAITGWVNLSSRDYFDAMDTATVDSLGAVCSHSYDDALRRR